MFIGVIGLHGAGKSYFCRNIPPKFGFKVFSKQQELAKIYKEKTGKEDWEYWYRRKYEENPKIITEFILSVINKNENTILDAVNSQEEWLIIKDHFPKAQLVEVIAPEDARLQRISLLDMEDDLEQIENWYDENGRLFSEVMWSFNNAASAKLNEQSFKELVNYMKLKEKKENDIIIK